MDARSAPGLNDPFEEAIDDALGSLPADLRAAMSNVEIVVEDEPPDGQPLLGLYRGVPLPRRSSTYSGVLPDKISIFGGPITRLAAGDADRLRREVRHVVLHEIAHHCEDGNAHAGVPAESHAAHERCAKTTATNRS